MNEAQAVISLWSEAVRDGKDAVLATVVRVEGSAYRRPGARMLLVEDGRRVGSVSGGCLEGDVARKAWWLTGNGSPALVRYSTREEEEGERPYDLGCEGVIHVLLERLRHEEEPVEPIHFLASCVTRRRAGVLATVIGSLDPSRARVGDRVTLDADGHLGGRLPDAALARSIAARAADCLRRGASEQVAFGGARVRVDVFLEVVRPPRSLVVFGGGHDAVPLVRLAKELGWHVTVADARAHYARRDRFPVADEVVVTDRASPLANLVIAPGTACVVMTHSVTQDRALLRALSTVPVAYLGLLGPRRRAERLLAESGAPTFACAGGLHSPIGLDLGGETPEEIALAILAEAQACLSRREGRSLRDRPGGSIHLPAAPLQGGSRGRAAAAPALVPEG
ncbi:XdhC family protein [Sorangium sp. So ce1014]|uniref:XdhC family protein n=1 Tax=Sorangium sp. So ce1014 TaxID=3133326 RepID=UPI003F62160E